MNTLWGAGLVSVDGRTVQQPSKVDKVPSSLLLKITGTCNFACTYCYDYDKERFSQQLSLDRIRSVISDILRRRNDLTITFHGGEPLLRFALLRSVVEFSENLASQNSKTIRFSIQTNGSRFSPEIVSFLVEHKFSVGISLDGIGDAPNVLRPARSGPAIFSYIERLFEDHEEFVQSRCGFLAVVSSASLPHIVDFALWLQDRKVGGLSLSFYDKAGAAINTDDGVTPAQAVALTKELVQLIDSGQIWDLQLQSLLSRLDNFYHLEPRDFCHKGPCAASSDFLVLDASGQFRTCDCVYDPFFEAPAAPALTIEDLAPARIRVVERHTWLGSEGVCSACPLFGLCGGSCPAKAIAANGASNSVDPIECAIAKYLYPEVLARFNEEGSDRLIKYYLHHRSVSTK